nr:hypothetical protein [Escherichia coli]
MEAFNSAVDNRLAELTANFTSAVSDSSEPY